MPGYTLRGKSPIFMYKYHAHGVGGDRSIKQIQDETQLSPPSEKEFSKNRGHYTSIPSYNLRGKSPIST